MTNVIGPDVSFYQDNPGTSRQIDFVKMKQSAGYVIIRAGQNLWVDSDFGYNWSKAKEAGLPRGSYWFYDSRADPKKQADLWFTQISNDPGELPLFADLEETYNGSFAGWKHWYTFIERIRALISNKQEIGIYTGYYYWLQNAPSKLTDPVELEYFHQYPLWIANYGVTTPSVPAPWDPNEWVFWQYTDKGDGPLFGVESLNVDMNYFNGDTNALKSRFKLGDQGNGGGSLSTWYKVTTAALNVREGPGTGYKVVGTLYRNEVIEGLSTSPDGTWVQIKRHSDGLTGWASRTYMIITIAPAPTPDPTPDPTPVSDKWYKVNASALNVREGPATSYKSLGTVKRDEVVEKLDASSDGGWLQIKRYSDGFTGWSSRSFLVVTTAPVTVPPDPIPDPPPPDPTPDPTPAPVNWYKVNASALNVREGPATSYQSLGTVLRNEVVEELAVSADGGWAQIKRPSDGLTGWSSKTYLVLTTAPATTPTTPPVDDTTSGGGSDPAPTVTWYRVTATSLNVREVPSASGKYVGSVKLNQVVLGLETSSDGGWIRIKRPYDGLTGWSSKDFLVTTTEPIPAEDPVKKWYKVTATSLNVREGPSTTEKSIGYLQKDNIVQLRDTSSDGSWIKILRFDGLEGWTSSQYLLHLDSAPDVVTQGLFNGVTYTRKETSSPRKIVSHALAIDLKTPGTEFLVTPPMRDNLPYLCTQKTTQFLAGNKLQVAINGDGFYYLDPAEYPPQNYCAGDAEPIRLIGYAASRGKEYTAKVPGKPIIFINRNNEITFGSPKGAVYNALTGDRMLVDKNKKVTGLDTSTFDPRSAIGMNQNGSRLYLVVVDGREFSEGVNFDELADILLSLGAYTAMSLDGGGSSALVVEGVNGQPHVLNTLIDENIPGQERSVANHLGIFIKK